MVEKLAELRRQIEMRTAGLGWTQFAPGWGFDPEKKEETVAATIESAPALAKATGAVSRRRPALSPLQQAPHEVFLRG